MNKPQLPSDLAETVKRALAEDVGSGDITAQLIDPNTSADAQVSSREQAILCGTAWFEEVFKQLDSQVRITWYAQDGDNIHPNQVLCNLTGSASALVTGERTALNFLQLLSGTATETQRYVKAISGTKASVLDTRKTLPGLRRAQKYAVRCGGGTNHRMGLYDAFLIKENHLVAAGSVTKAINQARHHAAQLPVEVEVETLEQIKEALAAGADSLLLDNFTVPQLREAVALVSARYQNIPPSKNDSLTAPPSQVTLEASGGINLETIRAVAETGVDFISVGVITKDVRAVDLSMRFTEMPRSGE
jgi:nicotinate-nucleotide pyrophosphorylase (carboxylating)